MAMPEQKEMVLTMNNFLFSRKDMLSFTPELAILAGKFKRRFHYCINVRNNTIISTSYWRFHGKIVSKVYDSTNVSRTTQYKKNKKQDNLHEEEVIFTGRYGPHLQSPFCF